LAEYNRLGVSEFSKAIDPKLTFGRGKFVRFRDIDKLDPKIRQELAECYLIGEIDSPEGISFCVEDGTYYLSIDGKGVSSYFSGYRSEEISKGVFRLYR
jgi:hypothetical protein